MRLAKRAAETRVKLEHPGIQLSIGKETTHRDESALAWHSSKLGPSAEIVFGCFCLLDGCLKEHTDFILPRLKYQGWECLGK